MKNLLIVALPAFFWATSDVLTRVSSVKINATLGSWILALGMLITLTVGAFLVIPSLSKEIISTSPKYAWIALFAGMANAIGLFFFFKFLQQGGNFTQGMPMILIGIVIFVTLYGIIFFKDPLTIKTGIGLVSGAAAIYFLSS